MTLLQKTVPIYSRDFFDDQFQPTKSVVKGWTYIRQGVYWCDKAFDKGAKGGKVWSVDLDQWREGGRAGNGWTVNVRELEKETEAEVESEAEEVDSEDEAEAGVAEEDEEEAPAGRKRKAAGKSSVTTPRKRQKTATTTPKKVTTKKKVPHPKSSTSHLPTTIPAEDLPTDPYERALRLLHVGATPDSLPCREEEFVDVLSRVEEGVEGGGGGCLCTLAIASVL